jgi:hypothetical protein
VAAVLGFGILASGYGASFDFGARAGYTLPVHLYLGAELGYGAGASVFNVQGEVGYDIGFPGARALMLRPYVGLGLGYVFVGNTETAALQSFCNDFPGSANCSGSGNVGAFLLSPGAVVAYHVTRSFFIGGDVRVPIFIGSGSTVGFDVLATSGFKF